MFPSYRNQSETIASSPPGVKYPYKADITVTNTLKLYLTKIFQSNKWKRMGEGSSKFGDGGRDLS